MQLLRLVLPPQRPSQLPAVYVSLYESGSEDTTPVYLAVLDHLLSAAGVPASIVIKGDLVRTEGDYRITYLAKVGAVWAVETPHFWHPVGQGLGQCCCGISKTLPHPVLMPSRQLCVGACSPGCALPNPGHCVCLAAPQHGVAPAVVPHAPCFPKWLPSGPHRVLE